MGPAARALAPFEVAVRRGGAALARLEPVAEEQVDTAGTVDVAVLLRQALRLLGRP